jgi:hypothetical protein
VKSNGKLAIFVSAAAGVSTASYDGIGVNTLSAGTWYHVAMTYDSANGLVGYVNGVADGVASATPSAGTLTANTATTSIGTDLANAGRNFDGAIDEVTLDDIARPASWIAAQFNNQSAPFTYLSMGTLH